MSKDFEFEGSGFKGAAFEQKGMEARNLQTLLKALSNKTTQKSIESLSKFEKDDWKGMATTAETLNSFITLGGNVALFNTMTESIKTTVKLQIESFLSPIENTINQKITDLINPFLDILNPVVNDLTTFLTNNATGAAAGGIAGAVAGKFLKGGPIYTILGSLIGGQIEAELTKFFAGEDSIFDKYFGDEAGNFFNILGIMWERFWDRLFGGVGGGGGGGGGSTPGPGTIRLPDGRVIRVRDNF